MATSAEPLSPSGPSLDTDSAAIAAAAALEMTTHTPLSIDATYATTDTAAIDDEDDDSNNVRIPLRLQEPHPSKSPRLTFLAPQSYLCVHTLRETSGR